MILAYSRAASRVIHACRALSAHYSPVLFAYAVTAHSARVACSVLRVLRALSARRSRVLFTCRRSRESRFARFKKIVY
jgi:hypothetical protein